MTARTARKHVLLVALAAAWTACAGPSRSSPAAAPDAPFADAGDSGDAGTSDPARAAQAPRTADGTVDAPAADAAPADDAAPTDDALDDFLGGAVPNPTPLGEGERPGPLAPRPLPEPDPFGDHARATAIDAPDRLPVGEDEGVLRFERFGPAPGTTPEQFAAWGNLLAERFLADPEPERLPALDAALAELPIVDATPAFINALHGLDMGDPTDIERAVAVSRYWYDGMVKYKHVVLDEDTAKVSAVDVRNRMLVVDGWIRLWQRTLDREGGVDRLRTRVEKLVADREASRERAQQRYEEKLRRRAELAGEDTDAAVDDEPR